MWKALRLQGNDGWLEEAIAHGTLRAVTDGSYIRELHPELCSAAFILECSEGGDRMIGSFPEGTVEASVYGGEMLGLLAIHLILAAVNKLQHDLHGHVRIFSDCLGALGKVAFLPTSRVPSNTKHSDILKLLMIHCNNFSFSCAYLHVIAHQDDHEVYHRLAREAQLNCQVDYEAKTVIWGLEGKLPPAQDMFPLEPMAIILGRKKLTTTSGSALRYWAHRNIARRFYAKQKILFPDQFDEVAWKTIHEALWEIPRMFQLWGAKQVLDIAGTNEMQARYKEHHDKMCPSCSIAIETCAHVLFCREEGRLDVLDRSIDLLDDYLIHSKTNRELRYCLIDFACGQGQVTMWEIVRGKGPAWQRLAISQDKIGWRRFMEGMISKKILNVHYSTSFESEDDMPSPTKWAKGLVVKLMEVTHGQWLYRNVHVHDAVSGSLANAKKEELKRAIKDELALGGEGLAEEDLYLLEINLDELDTSSGESQIYWLMAIRAARAWRTLQQNSNNNTTN